MSKDSPLEPPETAVKTILEWLTATGNRTGQEEAAGLRRHLLALRGAALPAAKRFQLLDLLYDCSAKVTLAQFPSLHAVTLPVSRQVRQLVRAIQDLLEVLIQDYLGTLTEPPNTPVSDRYPSPLDALRRAMQCLSWHLTVSCLAAAPTGTGLWQQLHSTFRTARQLELDAVAGAGNEERIDRIYLSSLLLSVVQPASFNSRELEFIGQYIEQCRHAVELSENPPPGRDSIFWIDPDRDSPPHPLSRRTPPPETPVFYFACDNIAQEAANHLAALENDSSAADLGLPEFAQTHAGHGVLKRLSSFWGHPAKRKFPRRRQSYRADLCAGLDHLWQLFRTPGESIPPTSEWMITNQSPDGYAMMHVSGATEQLRVGDIVAVRPRQGETSDQPWQICLVRWALSENPEHIELGLQVIAGRGIPATLALSGNREKTCCTSVLLLPEAPPVRPTPALIVSAGTLQSPEDKLILVVDQDNVAVRELRATRVDEHTSSIEVFTVEPDERP